MAQGSWPTAPHPPRPPLSLRREETPGCGGFLCRRRTPRPLPLDTLVFFVTCFSFCFSSLVPFFHGHFHFRLSVSPPPHPHPSFPLGPPLPPTTLGSPVAWPASASVPVGVLAGVGVRGRKGLAPCLFPTVGKPRWLSPGEARQGLRVPQPLWPRAPYL